MSDKGELPPSFGWPAITAAEQRGAERERKRIVAWLREQAAWHDRHDDGLSGFDRISQAHLEAADAIASNQHGGTDAG